MGASYDETLYYDINNMTNNAQIHHLIQGALQNLQWSQVCIVGDWYIIYMFSTDEVFTLSILYVYINIWYIYT